MFIEIIPNYVRVAYIYVYNCLESFKIENFLQLLKKVDCEFQFSENLSKFFHSIETENGNQGKRKSFAVVHFHHLRFHFQLTLCALLIQSVSH